MSEIEKQAPDEITDDAKAVLKTALGKAVHRLSPMGRDIKAILDRDGFVATDREAETLRVCLTLHRHEN